MSICKHTEFCGGCSMQGISYEQQLAIKEDQVQKLLQEKNIHPREYREFRAALQNWDTGIKWNTPSGIW